MIFMAKQKVKSIAGRTIALHTTNIYIYVYSIIYVCVFASCFFPLLARCILLAAQRVHIVKLQTSDERKTNANERSPTEKEKYFHIGLGHTKNAVMQSSRKGFAPKTTPLNSPHQYNGSITTVQFAHIR